MLLQAPKCTKHGRGGKQRCSHGLEAPAAAQAGSQQRTHLNWMLPAGRHMLRTKSPEAVRPSGTGVVHLRRRGSRWHPPSSDEDSVFFASRLPLILRS